jgi:hypothetical protein
MNSLVLATKPEFGPKPRFWRDFFAAAQQLPVQIAEIGG